MEPWDVKRAPQKHATLVFSIFQFNFAEQMEEVAGVGNCGL